MKGKVGRPSIPLSKLSNRKTAGLTGGDIGGQSGDALPADSPANSFMARGGTPKKRLDKKSRGGKAKNFIAKAIKHPGAMTEAAKREGVSNKEYEKEHKHDSGKSGERARLAITLSKMHKK